MSAWPAIRLHHLGAGPLQRALDATGAPHLPMSLLSEHYATGNPALHAALRTKVAQLVQALEQPLRTPRPHWHNARADVLALDIAFVEHPRQPFDLAWVEIQAFTSMLPTFHTLHLAQRRLHRLDHGWLPHDPTPPGVGWTEHLRRWVAPDPATVLIEDRPRERFNWPDLDAARHWWQVAVHDWAELVPAHGRLYHPGTARQFGHAWNRLILSDLTPFERRRAEATLMAADRIGWHSHPAWYEGIHKGSLAEVPLAPHETCHWVEDRPPCAGDDAASAWVAKAVGSHSGGGLLLAPSAGQLAALPTPRQWIVQKRFRQTPIGTHPETGHPLFGEVRCILGLSAGRPPWVMAWILRLSTDGIATLTGRQTLPGEGMTTLYFDTGAG